MTGPERVEHPATHYSPFGNIVFDPHGAPPAKKLGKKDGKSPQPPRPQNAWILYRAWALGKILERQPELKGTPQSQISKVLATQWAKETPEIRSHFEQQANLNKERHAQRFPEYVFKPQKKEEKEKERERKKKERARVREAERLRREVEKSMRAGYIPAQVNTMPTPIVLHQLALLQHGQSGSPPVSQCPSPGSSSRDDPLFNDEFSNEMETSSSDRVMTEASASLHGAHASTASEVLLSTGEASSEQQTAFMTSSVDSLSQSNDSMSLDPSACASPDVPFDWSRLAAGNMDDLEAFIKQAFPPGMPSAEPNRFEMPSGNIIISPGFVDGVSQFDNSETDGLMSIPLDKPTGILDERYDCGLVNPFAKPESSSSAKDSVDQPGNEAMYIQPFLQLDVSMDHLLSAGKQVGDALLDEQEASANGERVIAAEHKHDSAPLASVAKPGASSFLPSPPESSSSATSPYMFDFPAATNLSASGSTKQSFSDLGFSDTMSNSDMGSSAWSLPSFGDLRGSDSLGFNPNNAASKGAADFQGDGLFSSVPPTPVSAGPWLGSGFDIGEPMSDLSTSSNPVTFSDDGQAQKENTWFSSYFHEPGSGPV